MALVDIARPLASITHSEVIRSQERLGNPISLVSIQPHVTRRDGWKLVEPASGLTTLNGQEYQLGGTRMIMLPQGLRELQQSERQDLQSFFSSGLTIETLNASSLEINNDGSTSPVWHVRVGNRDYAMKYYVADANTLAGRAAAFDLVSQVEGAQAATVPTYAILDIPNFLVAPPDPDYPDLPPYREQIRLVVMEWVDGPKAAKIPAAAIKLFGILNSRAPSFWANSSLEYDDQNVSNIVNTPQKSIIIDHL